MLPFHQAIYSVGTLAASAAVLYGLTGSPIALVGLTVLVAHEFGHYFAALSANGTVKLPLFIPLGFITIGATYIKDVPLPKAGGVALAGGIVALITLTLILLAFIALEIPEMLIPILGFAAYEVVSISVGSDGRKYRSVQRRLNANNNCFVE